MTLQEQFKTCFNELTPEYTRIGLNQERIWNCRQERAKIEEKLKVEECTPLYVNRRTTIDKLSIEIEVYSLQINACIGVIVSNIRRLLVANGYNVTSNTPVAWNMAQDIKTLVDREDISEKKFQDGLKYITSKWEQVGTV
nr:MAG TPA: hypothetical protein [Caudoviricetes sp.]